MLNLGAATLPTARQRPLGYLMHERIERIADGP
jgi:hypothetical protein